MATVLGWKNPALGQSCCMMFPPGATLTAPITAYPNWAVTNGDPNPDHGFTTPASYFAVDVTDSSEPIPEGVYPAWCIDVNDDISPTPYVVPGSTIYSGTLISTCDSNALLSLPTIDDPIPVGPPPIVTMATWHEVNYILNHSSPPNYNYYWWNVEAALLDLVGGPLPTLPPGFPPLDTNQVAAILADAASNAPSWTLSNGDVVGVIFNISTMLNPNQSPPFQILLLEVPYTCPPHPSLQLYKTASTNLAMVGAPVTYYYAVTNTGNVTITNINIVDDNGTPTDTNDDYYVNATPFSLAAGQGTSFAISHITEPLCVTNGGTNFNVGSLTVNVLPDGNVEVYYLQSQSLDDNRYGTNANAATGWPKGRSFSDLVGKDNAAFLFTDGKGKQVLAFEEDYISQATSAKFGDGATNYYPSGYGTLGPLGGNGSMLIGSSSNVLLCRTTLSDSLNQSPAFYHYTLNSPPETSPLSNVSVPAGWDYTAGYYVLISSKAFGTNGFGSVIPMVYNSASKLALCGAQCVGTCGSGTVSCCSGQSPSLGSCSGQGSCFTQASCFGQGPGQGYCSGQGSPSSQGPCGFGSGTCGSQTSTCGQTGNCWPGFGACGSCPGTCWSGTGTCSSGAVSCWCAICPVDACDCVENTAWAFAYAGTNLIAASFTNATVCFTPNTNVLSCVPTPCSGCGPTPCQGNTPPPCQGNTPTPCQGPWPTQCQGPGPTPCQGPGPTQCQGSGPTPCQGSGPTQCKGSGPTTCQPTPTPCQGFGQTSCQGYNNPASCQGFGSGQSGNTCSSFGSGPSGPSCTGR